MNNPLYSSPNTSRNFLLSASATGDEIVLVKSQIMKKWQHFSLSLPNTYSGKHKYFLSSNQTKLEKSKTLFVYNSVDSKVIL